MFKDTVEKIRDMVAELDDDLPCSLTVRAFAEDIQKELDELIEFREQLGKNMDELESQLDARDRRIKVLEDIIEHYRRTVEYNNNAFTKLFNDKKELSEEISKQAELIKKLENEINYYKESTKRDNDEISKLQDALKEKDERIKALEPLGAIDVYELLKDYRSFNDEIKELREENESLKRKADGWKENAKRSVATIDYMRNENDKIEKYVDKLNCDIAQKDEQIEKLNKELAIARVGSQTRMSWDYTISRDETLKAINEAIKKLSEEN